MKDAGSPGRLSGGRDVAESWIRDCANPKEGLLSDRIGQHFVIVQVLYFPQNEDARRFLDMIPGTCQRF